MSNNAFPANDVQPRDISSAVYQVMPQTAIKTALVMLVDRCDAPYTRESIISIKDSPYLDLIKLKLFALWSVYGEEDVLDDDDDSAYATGLLYMDNTHKHMMENETRLL